jgi:anthranilate/para-aminobenzoate synthase component I
MNFETCRAAFVRSGVPGTALLFGGEGPVLTGTWKDWDRIEAALQERKRPTLDAGHPPGGLAGAFAYDGSFVFHHCPQAEVVSTDDFWPRDHAPHGAGINDGHEGWSCQVGEEWYTSMVRQAQEFIRAGDIYQVNLARSYRRRGAGHDSLRSVFRHLWATSEAPLSAWVQWPGGALASASPELFLSIDGRQIITRPIKGTRPRDRDPLRDSQNAYDLTASPKELAELVMITDLERNDLGQVCEFGSVDVTDLVKREAFSHVHHLISTVQGRLRAEVSPLQAVRACFPGGSITGAPKKRACEIIAALEPEPRGWYTGAMGYFGFDGTVQLNITIRTLIQSGDEVSFFTGSGITADSDPVQEFIETRHKAAALLQAWGRHAAVTDRPAIAPV